MEWSDMAQVLGFAGAMIVWTVGMLRYIIKRMDDGDRVNRDDIEALHSRVNDVKDNYVRRDDFQEAVKRMERTLDKLHDAVSEQGRHVNRRFDTVLTTLAQLGADTSERGEKT